MMTTVKNSIEKYGLLSPADTVLVALSGGADSVALLRVLLSLGYRCKAAHCNFHLRGEESRRDERFVRELCQRLDVPLFVEEYDTEAYAVAHKCSVEVAARELRYAFFRSLVERGEADKVAVAHHRDDSLETMLMNLMRGTGLDGLTGIARVNGAVVRPLSDVTRREIVSYLEAMQQPFVTDSTNLENDFTRNRIRNRLLPLMEEIFPQVRGNLLTTMNNLTAAREVCQTELERLLRKATAERTSFGFRLSLERLRESPTAMLLFHALHPLGFNAPQIAEMERALDGDVGRMWLTGEWMAVRDRTTLDVARRSVVEVSSSVPLHAAEGSVTLDGVTAVSVRTAGRCVVLSSGSNSVTFDFGLLRFPLTMRKWRAGERFVPQGMRGTKLVSDYLTNEKCSRIEKMMQWVVCSGEEIVWVVGRRADARFLFRE